MFTQYMLFSFPHTYRVANFFHVTISYWGSRYKIERSRWKKSSFWFFNLPLISHFCPKIVVLPCDLAFWCRAKTAGNHHTVVGLVLFVFKTLSFYYCFPFHHDIWSDYGVHLFRCRFSSITFVNILWNILANGLQLICTEKTSDTRVTLQALR